MDVRAVLDADPRKQRILFMGARKTGKTSALKVLFEGMTAKQTMRVIPPTQQPETYEVNLFAPFQIWDTQGSLDLAEFGPDISKFSVMVWFIDLLGTYTRLIPSIAKAFCKAHAANPKMKLAVFAHKADAVGDEEALADEFSTFQMDLEDEIAYAMDQLAATDESLVGLPPPQPTCHLTSIYDFRLALAFSQVIVSALRPAANLSGVLDSWSTASSVDKSFLFDVASKIYVSTDSAPVQPLVHDACVQWLTRLNAENKDFAAMRPNGPRPADPDQDEDFTAPPLSLSTDPSCLVLDDGRTLLDLQEGSDSDSGSDSGDDSEDDPDDEPVWDQHFVPLSSARTLAYWQITPTLALVSMLNSATLLAREEIEERTEILRNAVHAFLRVQVAHG